MTYYLGIDGGGTKTKICIIDDAYHILGFATSGPSSIDTVENNITFRHIQEAVLDLTYQHPECHYFSGVFAGLGGIVTQKDKDQVRQLLTHLSGVDEATTIHVESDVINALASGDRGLEGIVLISGTGMSCFGIDSHHHTHKAGGWGFKEGDAGSAYDLGYHAIKSMVRSYDGRYPMSDFAQAIAKELSLTTLDEIVPIMDQLWGKRTQIASLAPLVTKAANDGDLQAKRIIDEATDELALAVKTVYSHLSLNHPYVCIVGSLGNASGYFKDQLHQKIKAIDSSIDISTPQIDPAFAAAKLAMTLNH